MTATCPVCAATAADALVPVLRVPAVPALCNAFATTSEAARAMPRGDIDLVACTRCGMLHNAAFDPALATYDAAYGNALHHSPSFQAFAGTLGARLAAAAPPGGTVVEVGAGRGEFLRELVGHGFGRGVGFDPSLAVATSEAVGDGVVELVPGTLDAAAASGLRADLVACRHVLEHVADPVALLRAALAVARPGASLYVEVPDATFMLRELAVWDLIHEHVGYFTAAALVHAARRAGWLVTDHGTAFGGQYLWVEARSPAHAVPAPVPEPEPSADLLALAAGFASAYEAVRERWRRFVAGEAAAGRGVAVWGAGSKGVAFVDAVGGRVDALLDVSPDKQGRFAPGTGTPVSAPAVLRHGTGTVLVMNPIYLDEVRACGGALGAAVEYVAV